MRPGASFEDADVARAYVHRPDYAYAVYGRLLELSPRHGHLLDLGCGTGKVSRRLAGRFRCITAIDRQWPDIAGEATADSSPVHQRVEDFVACQHSRDTFAPVRLGARMREFDRQLTGILEAHADNGVLTYVVRSTIVWGSIRTRP